MNDLSTRASLGGSDLHVSPMALGTMTFGREPWGCDASTSCSILDAFIERGGNFIDTADVYGNGASESIIGEYVAQRDLRDSIVLATKYSLGGHLADPDSYGNAGPSLTKALDASLRRLRTDHVDLFFMHVWDGVTPVEEVLAALDTARSAGKIRYAGLSNVPAWYAGLAHGLAAGTAGEPIRALQLEYSLVERTIEYEFPSFCAETGVGLMVWSPLGNGFLTGKYRRGDRSSVKEPGRAHGRLDYANPVADRQRGRFTERNWDILDRVQSVADDAGVTVPQVALRWVMSRPSVSVAVIGATKPTQVHACVDALTIDIPDESWQTLDELSRPAYAVPYDFMTTVQADLRSGAWRL